MRGTATGLPSRYLAVSGNSVQAQSTGRNVTRRSLERGVQRLILILLDRPLSIFFTRCNAWRLIVKDAIS